MKILVALVCLAILAGCGTTGTTSTAKINEVISSVTDIDCLVGFQLGANLGQSTSLKNEVVMAELKKYTTENETYKKCYKLGLVSNYIGTGDIADLVKNVLTAIK